jgi:SAM-dependent methyltransferase
LNPAHELDAPSAWVVRWASLISHGVVLDLACGKGRHSRFFLGQGREVVAVDREPQDIPGARFVQADLEDGSLWPVPGEQFQGIVVTNYLHRPLFPLLAAALAPDGVLIYETFMLGNERFGRPSNPAFLLQPGELLRAFGGLAVRGYEQGPVTSPKPAMIQRLCAAQGRTGRIARQA